MNKAKRERPILFSAPMVRAIVAGKKTQTRRLVKPQPVGEVPRDIRTEWYSPIIVRKGMQEPGNEVYGFANEDQGWPCPYGAPGDRLWVRESWGVGEIYDSLAPSKICEHIAKGPGNPPCKVAYPATGKYVGIRFRPSIHMPRWASRISLAIDSVRVERLQEISESDAIAEGCQEAANLDYDPADPMDDEPYTFKSGFMELWEQINGERSWDVNPWVWVVEFHNVDLTAEKQN